MWADLESHLVERASDKVPLIRIQAALGLSRLQDVEESANSASKTYLRLLASDPNKEVRRTALNNLVTSRRTLSAILDRVRDSNSEVRADTFRLLTANVRMKTLSIKQRVYLIQSGLRDRDVSVKKECILMVLEWLKSQNASVPVLLKAFDVQNSEDRLIETLIETLLEHVNMETIEWRKGTMTPELAVLWRVFVRWNAERNNTSTVEANLPENLIEFCELITSVVTESSAPGYTMRQVLQLCPWLEKTDEGGRRAILGLLCEISAENFLSEQDVESVACAIFTFSFGMEDFVSRMKEAIARCRQHLDLFEREESAALIDKQEARMAELKRLLGPSNLRKMMQKRERDEKIAAGEHVEGEESDEEEDETLAARKEELNVLLTLKKNRKMVSEWCWVRTMTLISQVYAHSLVRDVDSVSSVGDVAEQLLEFVPKYIAVAMSHVSMVVRLAAMKALGGIASLEVKRNAVQHVELLYHALSNDDVEVGVEALKVLFDLVLAAGFEVFTADPSKPFLPGEFEDDFVIPDLPHEYPEHSIFAVLHKYLHAEDQALQTTAVEGFTKLFATKKLVCARTLSELLVLLFNPDTNDNVTLQQSLSLFMPVFAFAAYANQQIFAESFLITLRRFISADIDSPLADAHLPTFFKFMLHLTDAAQLNQMHQKNMKPVNAPTLHNRLAIDVCTEILIAPGSKNAKIMAKFFGYFNVDYQDANTIRELEILLRRVQGAVKLDKTTEKILGDILDAIDRSSAVPVLTTDQENALESKLENAMDAAVDSLSGSMKEVDVVVSVAAKKKKAAPKAKLPPKSSKKLISAKSRRGRGAYDSDESDSEALDLELSSDEDGSNASADEEDDLPARKRSAKRSSASKTVTTTKSQAAKVARKLYEEEEESDESDKLVDEILDVAPSAKRVMAIKHDDDELASDEDKGHAMKIDESDDDISISSEDDDDTVTASQSRTKASKVTVSKKTSSAATGAKKTAKKVTAAKKASAPKRTTSKSKLVSASDDEDSDVEVENVENKQVAVQRKSAKRTSRKMDVDDNSDSSEYSSDEEVAPKRRTAKASAPKRGSKATTAAKASKSSEQKRLMKEMSAMLD